MRTLAVGDIHGCLRALDVLLEQVDPQPSDVVVTLGDYVDRGPDSKRVLDRLLELQTRCRLIPLKGNHDLMMIAARKDDVHFDEWLKCGGNTTLQSYHAPADWKSFANHIPQQHWQFEREKCVAYHETNAHFFVHANAYPDCPLAEQPDHMLFWEQIEEGPWRPHESGRR
jgi:serine/threonine protein phosphatase 1